MAGADFNNQRDQVLDATDLVGLIGEHVALQSRGREHVGLCPFHDDSRPSMAVVTHKGTPFFKCHACGEGGNAIDFMIRYHKVEFLDALRSLAERAGISLRTSKRASGDGEKTSPRATVLEANKLAASWFRRQLSGQAGRTATQALEQRGISERMREAFGVGVAPDGWDNLLNRIRSRGRKPADFAAAGLLRQRDHGDGYYDTFRNRIIFPICDELARPIAFGGRRIDPDEDPKYLNSPESVVFEKSKAIFGIHLAKRSIIDKKFAVITEGYTDCIACHQAGLTNVVATLGTALTREHAKILQRLCETVVLVFDGDAAGLKAADRAIEVFFAEPIEVKICTLPDGLDPDDLLRQPDGREQFEQAVASAPDALAYMLDRFADVLGSAENISAQQKHLQQFLNHLVELGFNNMRGVRRGLVLEQISSLIKLPTAEIERALPRKRSQPAGNVDPPHQTKQMEQSNNDLLPTEEPTRVPRARRLAEWELLAILLNEPALRSTLVQTDDDETVPVHDWLDPSLFAEPDASRVLTTLLAALRDDPHASEQHILNEIEDARLRVHLAELQDQCRNRFTDQPDQQADEIRRLCARLNETPARTSCTNADDVARTIEQIRRSKNRPAAIALTAR